MQRRPPKHRGIAYFVITCIRQASRVRPLRDMTGRAHFNKVFLTVVGVDVVAR